MHYIVVGSYCLPMLLRKIKYHYVKLQNLSIPKIIKQSFLVIFIFEKNELALVVKGMLINFEKNNFMVVLFHT